MRQQSIKQMRESLGIQQQDMAKKLGIGITQMYYIETGERRPSDKIKEKICELYGIDMNTLFLALKVTKRDKRK